MMGKSRFPDPRREAMAARIEEAFADPRRKFCFYTANSAETGSERLNAMPFWDWTPSRSHGGGGSTCLVPMAFGCRPVAIDQKNNWIKPLITDAAQVTDIVIPDPRQGVTGEVVRRTAELAASIPPGDKVRNPDIQSPLGIAELMWGSSFFLALIENPDEVHALLDKIAQFQIEYVRATQEAAGDKYNPCGFPPVWASGTGTMIADDTMSLISPAMHAEFSLPYINRIADVVGPLHYHSCSWRERYFDNIRKIRNVRAFNWNPGNSDDPATLIREFSGQAVLALHLCLDMHKDNDVLALGHNFADEAEFFEYCLDSMTSESCMYWWFSNIRENGKVMDKIYNMLDERGYTPAAAGIV